MKKISKINEKSKFFLNKFYLYKKMKKLIITEIQREI